MMSRRRGNEDDDEGAAPPVNHRYVSSSGMGGSSASHYSVNSNEESNNSPKGNNNSSSTGTGIPPPTTRSWMSPPGQQQQSASSHSGALLSPPSNINNNGNSNNNPPPSLNTNTNSNNSTRGMRSMSTHGVGAMNGAMDGNDMMEIMRASSSSSRYLSPHNSKSRKLPSRWVLDPQDRALMSVTSLDRTSLRLNHGPAGDTSHVTALPSITPNNSSTSTIRANCCVVVANHSIPLDYLKEVALKGGKNGGKLGGLDHHATNGSLSDDPLAESGGTIDQILSNLRSKPFSTASTTTNNRRASSASLYPSLPGGDRGGSGNNNGSAAGLCSSSSVGGSSAHHFRSNTGNNSGGTATTSLSSSSSALVKGRKTTSSPVYYFEVTIQTLPQDAVVSVGMVVTDGSAATTDDDTMPVTPGNIKHSIGVTSRGEFKVSGRSIEEKKFTLEEFQVGDVIGCGLEVVGTRRLFFTKNGKTIISPTRFQDVEPKHSAYSPSVGIQFGTADTAASSNGGASNGISVYANFGAKSGRAFQWEEAEYAHIVNGSSVSHTNQKKPPPEHDNGIGTGNSSDAYGIKSTGMNGEAAARSASHSEFQEERAVPSSQFFGKPSSRDEGLMSSLDRLPVSSDNDGVFNNNDNNGSNNNPSRSSNSQKLSQQNQTPRGQLSQASMETSSQTPKGPLSAFSSPAAKSSPAQVMQIEDLKVTPSVPAARKSSGRSKSPKGFFKFGRGSKKSSQDASSLGRNSSGGSSGSLKSRSNSPSFFGSISKKKKNGGLLDEDEDEHDLADLGDDLQKIADASVQEIPSAQRQTPVDGAILSAPQTAVGIPSTTPPPAINVLFGKKSKKSSLDDDNPTDVQLQSQVSSNATLMHAQTSGVVSGTPYLASQSSATGAPMLFGKKSKKSSLDDDNPSDVHLQTAISNDFPAGIARIPSGPNGISAMAAATGIAPTAAGQNGHDSGTPMVFGKKSKRGTLEDDDEEDHVQSNFANLPSDFEPAIGVASLPSSGGPAVFGSKSKKSSLEDDDPDDTQYHTHAQMTFGSRSRKSSLEDDDPDDDKYESHSSLTNAGVNLGAPSKKGSLEDDDDDDAQANHASLDPAPNGARDPSALLPDSNPMGAHRRESNPTVPTYGSKVSRNSLEDDDLPDDDLSGLSSNFGAPSKKGSLEDDDPNDSSYQSHSQMMGSASKERTSVEIGQANNATHPNMEQEQANGLPSMNPYQARGPVTPGNPARGSPQRHRQNMTRSAPVGAAAGNNSTPVSFDSPISSSFASAAHASSDIPDLDQLPDPQIQTNRNRPILAESAASSSSAQAPGPSDDDLLKAAIEESKRDQKKQEMQGQRARSEGGSLKDPKEVEAIRDNTRTLRMSCSDEGVDPSVLASLLEICREDQEKIQTCVQSDDPPLDFMEIISLNELVLDAIKLGQKMVEGSKKQAPSVDAAASVAASAVTKSSKTNLNLDIGALVEKKDIFSLICILRAQSDQRLDAALALMNFAREADSLAEAGTRSLRDEIRSSGGMHSLITVFRSKGASYELRVVSALAVAYVLPSFVESSSVHPSVGLKIMECLRFLSTSRPVSPNGRRISQDEMYRASAAGVTTFWINELTPMLNSGAGAPKNDSTERSDLFARTNKKGRRRGRTGGQRHQTLELQELLEMTVSLIVQIERLGENEVLKKNQSAQTDSLFLWRYTNVEQVCAVDVARPIAVREGLLPILVGWIRSGDREKVRPAVSSLRYLTSIKDKYMAGWIHSQMVNEGALAEVVKLADDYYVGQDVRLAVAQILASLCVAPHTRAAVVEAKCINYLIGFLYDHSDKASQDVALFAGSAILQLAEGAITRASVLGGGEPELQDSASPDKSDTLVDDIVNSGAIGSFIAIALNHEGKLRSMAIEAIRVLSEDTSPNRRTRSQLCEEGAAMSLGRALKDDVTALHSSIKPARRRTVGGTDHSLDELHDALCALANILEPIQPGNNTATKLRFVSSISDPTQNLIQGCIETAESGGLDSLLWISSLPLTGTTMSDSTESDVQRIDLLEEACRSLASLSPLLLSREPAAQGYSRCADSIFFAFDRILMLDSIDADNNSVASEYNYEQEAMLELNISALRGLGALATAEPLKIKIVDKTLPCLLQMRNSQNGNDISNVAGQVFLSLGFEEDEIAVQVAGSNPSLLADWFCLQRCLIIQAMARSEVRRLLQHIWKTPFAETKRDTVTRLIRESSARKTTDDKVVDSFAESFAEIDLFESFADDDFTEQLRHTMVRQYHEFYNMGTPKQSGLGQMESRQDDVSLLVRHMYPLCDTQTEIDWMLSHDESIYSKPNTEASICTNVSAPEHVEALLDCCFPSRLLRNHVIPVFNLRPEATFNFRALTMPQRKYFSFRREGQLLSRLCDKQAESLDFDDVHWTLGFMNCTFAGEFSETFVQALYLCPTIRGLSFGKNEDYAHLRALDGDDDRGEDGSTSLANLVGSLPPWIQSLTFSNIFCDREVKTIVGIIETMGKLSSDQAVKATSMSGYGSRGRDTSSAAQTQGKFWSFAICSSPRVSPDVWYSFFGLLGRGNSLPVKAASTPLSTLKVLDLSFNNLGDETCSLLLELIHDPESGCSLEQLDLSGNAIRKGDRTVDILTRYIEDHRFNLASDGKVDRNGWKATLHTLNLSANNLGVGKAASALVSLLKHNALGLKLLDLSSNGLDHTNVEYELTQEILSFIELNDMLCHLNLSNNGFSPRVLDDMLGQLAGYDNDSGLAFLGLDNNTPPLTMTQTDCLEEFLGKSRRGVLQKCLNERDAVMSGELLQPNYPIANNNGMAYTNPSDLSVIGESTVLKNQESDFTKSVFDEPEGQPGDNMITVLFSAPLVFTNERRQLKPFAKLDFDMERELMWQCMKEASRDIELFFDNATHDRLLAAITKRCSCLHYSGHGHPSYLPFEDGGGGPNWFKVEDIQRLIARQGAAPFKFVFVSACHSGLAGETFASAGVPHVVCCQQEFELKDTAALAFTRQFYLSLVVGHTVRESFEQGCKAVRATPNLRDSEKEMKKFLLLPKDGNHDVPIFNAKAVHEWPKTDARHLSRTRSKRSKSMTRLRNLHAGGARSSELGVRNMMQEDPSPTPPQFFLGREVSMYYVLKAILCKRLVSVVAEPGCGRSSLVCALCHYINERASTIIAIERIYFVKAKRSRGTDGCRALMEQLLRKLVESGKEDPPDPGVDMEDLFDFICKALKNEKALVVFDRMEYLENSDDAEEFPMLLSTLFRGTKNVKVLVTGRRQLGIPSLGGQVEYPYPLGPLSFENTLRLFANLCPHLHTAGERHKLFERLASDGEQSELHPSDSGISDRTRAIFKTIGDGIPSRIEQAAYDISSDGLHNLLEQYGV